MMSSCGGGSVVASVILRLVTFSLLSLVFFVRVQPVESFSSSSPSSPWAPATWILTLNFGREEISGESLVSNDYGTSGSRIVVPITVQVESTSLLSTYEEPSSSSKSFLGPGASNIVPQTIGSYVSMKGEQRVELSTGGWKLEFPPNGGGGTKGRASTLRFWMDLNCPLERNDVILPAGERLYFMTKVWREEEYDRGVQKMRPIYDRARQAQQGLEDQLDHGTGDRRLDGTDALETLQAYGDMAQLVLDRDRKRQELQQALEIYPPIVEDNDDNGLAEGPWPGAEEWLTISNSYNPIWVAGSRQQQRSKPWPTLLRMGEEFHVVGTWMVTPVLSEEEYEIVSDNDPERR